MEEVFNYSFPNYTSEPETKGIILIIQDDNLDDQIQDEFEIKVSEPSFGELTEKVVSRLMSAVKRDLSGVYAK